MANPAKFTAIVVALLTSIGFFASALAQDRAAPIPSKQATAGFQSSGIKAVISNAAKIHNGFSVQMIIQNLRTTDIYISPISSYQDGAGNTALGASGLKFIVDNGGTSFVGMTPCYSQGTFDATVSSCIKSFALENMTVIEPSQTAILGISYRYSGSDGDVGDSTSFALKFLVREASGGRDPIASAAGKVQEAGPARIVTISFPSIPMGNK